VPAALSRALAALAGIYRFPGTHSAPNSVELSLPVQIVHDVSREAELATGFFANAAVTLGPTDGLGTVARASTTRLAFLQDTIPAQLLAEHGYSPADVDVWVYGYWAIIAAADSGDFGHARVGVTIGTPIGGGNSRVLASYTIVDGQAIVAGGTLMLVQGSGTVNQPGQPWGDFVFPFLLPDDPESAFLMEGADDAGGAMTVGCFFRCWVGPKGSPPPV